jgi:PadR family transcriptional regulator, regulatory protein PadR
LTPYVDLRHKICMKISMASLKVLYLFASAPREQRTGYDISAALKLASGTLYPILARFEVNGILESKWETVDPSEAGRPRRRYYRLTPYGISFAMDQMRSLEEAGSGNVGALGWKGAGFAV